MIRNHIWVIVVICVLVIITIISLRFIQTHNRGLIVCDTRTELSNLLGSSYFIDAAITDIRYKMDNLEESTDLFITLRETADLQSVDYYFSKLGTGIYDPDLEEIPQVHRTWLKGLGLTMENIQGHGGNFHEIKVGFEDAPFAVHWYQIDETYDGKSNIILLTSIPRKISIDADKIIEN